MTERRPVDLRVTRRQALRFGAAGGMLALAPGVLAACGSDDVPPPPTTRRIGLSLADGSLEARCVATGVLHALQGSDYELEIVQNDRSARREGETLTRFAQRKVAGIVVQPVSIETATRGAQFAQQVGIRVATCMSPGFGPGAKFFAGLVEVPGRAGGELIGRWLIDEVVGGGEIVVVQGLLGQGVSEPLDEGLDAALRASDKLRIVARGPGGNDPREAVAVVRQALVEHPRASIVVDYGVTMGTAIARYLRDAGRDDIVHVTSGADPSLERWLRTPYLRATRFFSPARTGELAARMALEAIHDRKTALDPFTRTVPQSMRDAQTLAAAGSFSYPQLLPEVSRKLA